MTQLAQDRVSWGDPQYRLLLIDLAMLAFFVVLLQRFGRPWLVFAVALQLPSTASHLIADFGLIGPRAYLTVMMAFSYGVLFCLGGGALVAMRRRRRQRLDARRRSA